MIIVAAHTHAAHVAAIRGTERALHRVSVLRQEGATGRRWYRAITSLQANVDASVTTQARDHRWYLAFRRARSMRDMRAERRELLRVLLPELRPNR
jgi:hypothetical protein